MRYLPNKKLKTVQEINRNAKEVALNFEGILNLGETKHETASLKPQSTIASILYIFLKFQKLKYWHLVTHYFLDTKEHGAASLVLILRNSIHPLLVNTWHKDSCYQRWSYSSF